ncbi:MAG: hypothetical protein GXZ02_09800 [Clostridiales bacterium]|nr:hypothetical protein [Clostridiales bacterium]
MALTEYKVFIETAAEKTENDKGAIKYDRSFLFFTALHVWSKSKHQAKAPNK